MKDILFSSSRSDWETPTSLFNILNNIFKFSLDACASQSNTKCKLFIDEKQNCLKTNWESLLINSDSKSVFINPPYSSGLLLPIFKKIKEEATKGLTIVVLVAARTETQWHKIAWDYARYFCFFYQRIKFQINRQALGTPTFPSELIIFSNKDWNLRALESIAKIIPNPSRIETEAVFSANKPVIEQVRALDRIWSNIKQRERLGLPTTGDIKQI
jgi:phage N-6-adenine-methyltransferase